MRKQQALAFRRGTQAGLQEVPDSLALEISTVYDLWAAGIAYGGEERLDSAFDLPAAPAPSDGGEETPGLDSDESGTGDF